MRKLSYLLILLFSFSVLSAQEKLSKEEKARREKNIQAGNPFAKYGYKAKVATLSKGKYLEFHDLDSIVSIGTIRWHVDKNQIVGRVIRDTLNPDAQPTGDTAGRWMSPDPLSEEYPDWTPYRYGLDNPIRYADPTGLLEDDYGVDEGGNVTLLKKTDDNFDRLYAVDNSGNKKDTNNTGGVDTNDAVTVQKGIVGQLENTRPGSEVSGQSYFSSIRQNSSGMEADYLSVFKFVSDNTKVEFSLTSFDFKGKNLIELATYKESDRAPGVANLGVGIDSKNVNWHMHNHPDGYASEKSSMGIAGKDRLYNPSDARNALKNQATYPNGVYFPASKNLYNVTQYGVDYIRKVSTAQQLKIKK